MKKVVLSPSLNKRLISRLMSSRPTTDTAKNFKLKGSNEFVSRSNDVFGELKALEVAHESWISTNSTHENFSEEKVEENFQFVKPSNSVNQTVDNVRQNRKSKSDFLFIKPLVPKIRGSKNYASNKNRKKWIKYSLEDVPLSSNSTNASTALSFINELRKRKDASPKTSDANEKPLFLKPKRKSSHQKLSSSNNLLIPSSSGNKCSIKLKHLEDEDNYDSH